MVTLSYAIKFELDFSPKYKWLDDNSCYNEKTGRIIKQTTCGRSIGYVIDGKFKSLTFLRSHIVKPPKQYCPF